MTSRGYLTFAKCSEFWDEGRWSKLGRRLKEEPLVPVGLALTCYALYGATKSIRRGDKYQTNRFFRARVYAQGFTLLCIVVGSIYWKEDRDKRKHYQGLLGEKRAREKKEAWIRELEARDREDELERQKTRARRESRRNAEAALRNGEGEGAQAVNAVRVVGDSNSSAMDKGDLSELLSGSRILSSAMSLWWSRRDS